MTPGLLIVGYQYLTYLSSPVTESTSILTRYRAAKEHIRRIDELTERADLPKETAVLPRSADCLFETETFVFRKGNQGEEDLLYQLEDIKLELNQFIVIKGNNGTGKSMFLNLMAGLISLRHSEGTFELASSIDDLAYLTYPLFFHEGSFQENLFNRSYDPELNEILAIDFSDKAITVNPVNLSYGQQQKMALLRVLSMDKPILFLDEPFSNLDQETITRLIGYLGRIKRTKTIVAIMHDSSLDALADEILVIADKKLIRSVERSRSSVPSPLTDPATAS